MLVAILAAAGLCACSNDSDEVAEGRAELSKGNTATEELADSPQLVELQYTVDELEYPSYELTADVTDIADE